MTPKTTKLSLTFDRPGRVRADAISELKRAVIKLGTTAGRPGLKLARQLFESIPELRSA